MKRFHYQTYDELKAHLAAFLHAYNFAERLNTLRGPTPYEAVCRAWSDDPNLLKLKPTRLKSGLSI